MPRPKIFLMLQHPFADKRSFLGEPHARLKVPRFPMPAKGEFIRSSGNARRRLQGGVLEWAGEETYFSAKNSFRFCNHLSRLNLGTDVIPATPTYALRRFLSDGIVSRLEVGLRLELDIPEDCPIGTPDSLKILSNALCMSVTLRTARQGPKQYKLIEAGMALARHYLHATSNRHEPPGMPIKPWWFEACDPMLLVEYSTSNALGFPPHTRVIMQCCADNGAIGAEVKLSHCWMSIDGIPCSTWFVGTSNIVEARERVRLLRIHLLRLHAERECLLSVLRSIEDRDLDFKKDPDVSNAIQDYLNTAIRTLDRMERFGNQQHEILDAAQYAVNVALSGQSASLEKMRRQVKQKVDHFIEESRRKAQIVTNIFKGDQVNTTIQLGNVNVTGDFSIVTASNIQNSYNKAASADVRAELKQKLLELSRHVAELAKRLPEDKAENVSNDLQSLTSEAVSKSPRRGIFENSSNGLIKAAETVAEMAGPITIAVRAVIALLFP